MDLTRTIWKIWDTVDKKTAEKILSIVLLAFYWGILAEKKPLKEEKNFFSGGLAPF